MILPETQSHTDGFAQRPQNPTRKKHQDISFPMPEDNGDYHKHRVDDGNGPYDGDRDQDVIDKDHPAEKTKYDFSESGFLIRPEDIG